MSSPESPSSKWTCTRSGSISAWRRSTSTQVRAEAGASGACRGRCSFYERPNPVGWSVSPLGDIVRQAHSEPLFTAHQQFDSLQTAEAEVALKRGVEHKCAGGGFRTYLTQQVANDAEDALLQSGLIDLWCSNRHAA